ncbi:unnamed protein product [Rhizoctonia solani]|uniref:Uncharacterized protein n=1 Tax=Rhizoctonia solani TaxID=456999 RepID=A0A8H2WUR0_9AGAM|nr:unnamed protein product [Rhizoctonia solani]CAE6530147.1 unnamed protein product [Rhizoctonia solani]
MNDYSSLFTSGLMLLCDSAHTRSRHSLAEISPVDDNKNVTGLRSFLSLDMAESLRTFATGSPSNPASRTHSRKPSERRPRPAPVPAPVASSSKTPVSPASSRRRSLPQPKPAPRAELPVVPTAQTHTRSRSDSAASQALPALTVVSAPKSDSASSIFPEPTKKNTGRKEYLAPSSLKLELSTAPTTPCSQFPTTPRSSRAISMFSPLTPPASSPWFQTIEFSDSWSDPFAGALSPTTTESALGLHLPRTLPVIDIENIQPLHMHLNDRSVAPKRARARRTRHSAPSRNTSVTANSMRSSQVSVTTSYRRTQRSGALARLEGRGPAQRSEWMSDDEEAPPTKFKGLSLMPSMNFRSEYEPSTLRHRLAPYKSEDQNRSFIDLTDDVASLASRQPRVVA